MQSGDVEATEGGEQTSWGMRGAVSAPAGYGAASRSKKYVSKWTHGHGFFITNRGLVSLGPMILYVKHIIHIDDFPLISGGRIVGVRHTYIPYTDTVYHRPTFYVWECVRPFL